MSLYTSPNETKDEARQRNELIIAECKAIVEMQPPELEAPNPDEAKKLAQSYLAERFYGKDTLPVIRLRGDGTLMTYKYEDDHLTLFAGGEQVRRAEIFPDAWTMTHQGQVYAVSSKHRATLDCSAQLRVCLTELPEQNTIDDQLHNCLFNKDTGEFIGADKLVRQTTAEVESYLAAKCARRYQEQLVAMLESIAAATARKAQALDEIAALDAGVLTYVERPLAALAPIDRMMCAGTDWRIHTVLEDEERSVVLVLGATTRLRTACATSPRTETELPWPPMRPTSVTVGRAPNRELVVSAQIDGAWYGTDLAGNAVHPLPYQLTTRGERVPLPALVTHDAVSGYGRAVIDGRVYSFSL